MTKSDLRRSLLALLADDEQLYRQICEAGLVPSEDAQLGQEHLETARVVSTLVHELEVNWAGVEIVLHMRSQLVATRQQVAELAELVRCMQDGS